MGNAKRQNKALLHAKLIGTALIVASLTACSSQAPKTTSARSKEYFPESKYGVKASPRVTTAKANLPRGGGRYQVGKAYKVKGNWFHPKEDPNYSAVGAASWYGDAFHGRLTANGEVYDMTHLTAAHPTLPLPSYARVTNLANNSSVIVRINDRGPFERDRLIDLSKRAAELLDYHHAGTAKVKVEYVGPAPLHGQDDAFLMASYRPGGAAPDPSDGLPTGVMLAMNGPTPGQASPTTSADAISSVIASAYAMPTPASAPAAAQASQAYGGEYVVLPSFAPIPASRPGEVTLAALSYAPQAPTAAASVFDNVLKPAQTTANAHNGVSINLGVWPSIKAADAVTQMLSGYGQIRIEQAGSGQVALTLVAPDESVNDALQAAWGAGATDAFIVRD